MTEASWGRNNMAKTTKIQDSYFSPLDPQFLGIRGLEGSQEDIVRENPDTKLKSAFTPLPIILNFSTSLIFKNLESTRPYLVRRVAEIGRHLSTVPLVSLITS